MSDEYDKPKDMLNDHEYKVGDYCLYNNSLWLITHIKSASFLYVTNTTDNSTHVVLSQYTRPLTKAEKILYAK